MIFHVEIFSLGKRMGDGMCDAAVGILLCSAKCGLNISKYDYGNYVARRHYGEVIRS